MSSKKKIVSIGSACLIVLLFLIYPLPVTELTGEKHNYFIKEDEFILSWIHSIEKEEWLETYTINGEKFILTETKFKTFGAGTPYTGKNTSQENGFVKIELNYEYESLNITISENVKTTLFIESRKIPLYEIFAQYETVIIKRRNIPFWKYIRGDFL